MMKRILTLWIITLLTLSFAWAKQKEDGPSSPSETELRELADELEFLDQSGENSLYNSLEGILNTVWSDWKLDSSSVEAAAQAVYGLGSKYAIYAAHGVKAPKKLVAQSRELLQRALKREGTLWAEFPKSVEQRGLYNPSDSNFGRNHFLGASLILSYQSKNIEDVKLLEKLLARFESMGYTDEKNNYHVLVSAQRRLASRLNLPQVEASRSPVFESFENILKLKLDPRPPHKRPLGWKSPNEQIDWMLAHGHPEQYGRLIQGDDLTQLLNRAKKRNNDKVYLHLASLISFRELCAEPLLNDPKVIQAMAKFARDRVSSRLRNDGQVKKLESEAIILFAYGKKSDYKLLVDALSEHNEEINGSVRHYTGGKHTPKHLKPSASEYVQSLREIREGIYRVRTEKLLGIMADRLGLD